MQFFYKDLYFYMNDGENAEKGVKFMKHIKILVIALLTCTLLLGCLSLTACGAKEKTYIASASFNDDNPAGSEILTGSSMAKVETVLVVNGDTYTLTKTSYGAVEEDTSKVVEGKWYTAYKMAFQFVFEGSCTVDGDKVVLSVPTSAKKLCYYQFDVHAKYPSRFPIVTTVHGSQEDIATTTSDVVTLSATDAEMIYFNCLYIQTNSGDAVKAQTYTVKDGAIVSVS